MDVADEGDREVYDSLRQSARVHELAREEEERHSEELEVVRPFDELQRDDLAVEDAHVEHKGEAAHHERESDRHTNRHGAAEREQEDRDGHSRWPLREWAGSSSYSPANSRSSRGVEPARQGAH